MSQLTDDQVKHVAKLAKLTLTEEEVKKYQSQLSEIISYVEELGKVDTSQIDPISQTTELVDVFKEDVVQEERVLPSDQVVLNAKNIYRNYFVVNAVIDKDSA